ncbi:hypothetical protein D3C77_172920 [compost metagenome]
MSFASVLAVPATNALRNPPVLEGAASSTTVSTGTSASAAHALVTASRRALAVGAASFNNGADNTGWRVGPLPIISWALVPDQPKELTSPNNGLPSTSGQG